MNIRRHGEAIVLVKAGSSHHGAACSNKYISILTLFMILALFF